MTVAKDTCSKCGKNFIGIAPDGEAGKAYEFLDLQATASWATEAHMLTCDGKLVGERTEHVVADRRVGE